MQLDNATIKRLKGIGHELKPIVMIGNKGITPTITEEIDRALSDSESQNCEVLQALFNFGSLT